MSNFKRPREPSTSSDEERECSRAKTSGEGDIDSTEGSTRSPAAKRAGVGDDVATERTSKQPLSVVVVPPHVCRECGATFSRNYSLERHREARHGTSRWVCVPCGKTFRRKDYAKRHVQKFRHTRYERYEGATTTEEKGGTIQDRLRALAESSGLELPSSPMRSPPKIDRSRLSRGLHGPSAPATKGAPSPALRPPTPDLSSQPVPPGTHDVSGSPGGLVDSPRDSLGSPPVTAQIGTPDSGGDFTQVVEPTALEQQEVLTRKGRVVDDQAKEINPEPVQAEEEGEMPRPPESSPQCREGATPATDDEKEGKSPYPPESSAQSREGVALGSKADKEGETPHPPRGSPQRRGRATSTGRAYSQATKAGLGAPRRPEGFVAIPPLTIPETAFQGRQGAVLDEDGQFGLTEPSMCDAETQTGATLLQALGEYLVHAQVPIYPIEGAARTRGELGPGGIRRCHHDTSGTLVEAQLRRPHPSTEDDYAARVSRRPLPEVPLAPRNQAALLRRELRTQGRQRYSISWGVGQTTPDGAGRSTGDVQQTETQEPPDPESGDVEVTDTEDSNPGFQ